MIKKRSRVDAEYLEICLVLDDLETRPNGQAGRQTVMQILADEYSRHHSDVMTYLAVKSGLVKLKPEFEKKLNERHNKGGVTCNAKSSVYCLRDYRFRDVHLSNFF